MKLSRASSYALHAVAYMAQQKGDGPVPSHKIAQERGIPERFLLKVLKPLVSARVLASIKGPHGGYRLARSPSDITLLEVVEAIDGPIRGEAPPPEPADRKRYPKYKPEVNEPLFNKLNGLCRNASEDLRKSLGKVKLAELVRK